MPVPWLTALKVIPWGEVIEHAPTVLKGARDLLERQRQRRRSGGVPPAPAVREDAFDMPVADAPAVRALQQQLAALRDDLTRQQQTQDQITQTLAELAEQNTRLVAAVERLRQRIRLLVGAVLVLAVLLAVQHFSG